MSFRGSAKDQKSVAGLTISVTLTEGSKRTISRQIDFQGCASLSGPKVITLTIYECSATT
jgi:hypothetical protein